MYLLSSVKPERLFGISPLKLLLLTCILLVLVIELIHTKSSTISLFCNSIIINDSGKSSGTGPVISFILRFRRNRRGGYVPGWLEGANVGMVPDMMLSLRSSSSRFVSEYNISVGVVPTRLLSSENRVDGADKEGNVYAKFK